MLQAVSLSKAYIDGSNTVTALDSVSADFHKGRVTAIIGPSGSGKSTLLNLLAQFDVPTGGEVRLDGRSLANLSEIERCDLRLTSFGFVFQSYNLVNVLTAAQNVEFPLGLRGVPAKERRDRARALLERFSVGHRAHHLPTRLSGGERQRVALARCLANDPQVVMADEPTGNLDSRSGDAVIAALREVAADGRTVIIVTHDMRVADASDEVIRLFDGRVVSPAPTEPRAVSDRPAAAL